MSTYSPNVEAVLDEQSRSDQSQGPKMNLPRVTLNGQITDGKFYILERTPDGKYEEKKKLYGPEPHDRIGGVIIRAAYMVKWKYREGIRETYQTREFTDWQSEPIELLHMTFGENGSTKSHKVYPNWASFKEGSLIKDPMTGKTMPAPYDLHVVLYLYRLTEKRVVKLILKGSNVSSWFDFKKEWHKPFIEAKPRSMLQIRTTFHSVKRANPVNGMEFMGCEFAADSMCSPEEMEDIVTAYREIDDWAKAWANLRRSTPSIKITADHETNEPVLIHEDAGKQDEIDLSGIPF